MATILAELAEQLDPPKLVDAAKTAPVTWAQRMGYLLDHVGGGGKTAELGAYVQAVARDAVALVPAGGRNNARLDSTWKVYVNTEVEAEF